MVQRKSKTFRLRFDWVVALYIFNPLPSKESFLIIKQGCAREELIGVVFFLQKQLQQITVREPIFGEFVLAPLTFVPCTSPTNTFPSTPTFCLCQLLSERPSTASPFARKTISNTFNVISASLIILDEEGVPIFDSRICLSPLAVSFDVDKLKFIIISSLSVPSPS